MTETDPTSNTSGRSRSKLAAACVSIVVIGVMMSPIAQNWSDDPNDDFPLSYYPMFTKCRDQKVSIVHVVGFDQQGKPYRIRYNVAGPGGMNQVRKQVRRQVAQGRADKLCRDVAKRIRKKDSDTWDKIESVEVVKSVFDLDQFARGKRQAESLTIEATRLVD